MSTKTKELTPMMKQWTKCKETAGSALLLFRLGDFYECFYEDAEKISSLLMITLTKRQNTPMAGIPAQTLHTNLDKLIGLGVSVAIAEQAEKKDDKTIVDRAVTSIVTPATYTPEKNFNSGQNNFLLAISFVNKSYAISYIDTSTAEFYTSSYNSKEEIAAEVIKISPKEVLVCQKHYKKSGDFFETIQRQIKTQIIPVNSHYFSHEACIEKLHQHFQVRSLDGFGLKGEVACINGCGAILQYLENEIFFDASIVKNIVKRDFSNYLFLDYTTLSHLEVFTSNSGKSLVDTMNYCKTAMGIRKLKNSLLYPLIDKDEIITRQHIVETMINKDIDLSEQLQTVKDIERLLAKIGRRKATPSDLLMLGSSLKQYPLLKTQLQDVLKELCRVASLHDLSSAIETTIDTDQDGYIIAKGINEELDKLKSMEKNSCELLQEYEQKCKDRLGIKTLKIGHSRSYGYFIEVSKKATHLMPEEFSRRQTLVNAERFITSELSTIESEILHAKEKALQIEKEIFDSLVEACITKSMPILHIAKTIAKIDFFHSLKTYAVHEDLIKPVIHEGFALDIKGGCHPILVHGRNKQMYIPNSVYLDNDESLAILTGPNMAGKSTYIKSIALLTILSQVGSFIPAASAMVPITDKIFTRIGASDDLQKGQSTFMVEMSETANILRNATKNSLLILDEIGRGTATFDGIALAKSIATFISQQIGAKALFATHYLELTELEKTLTNVKNIRSCVKEENGDITFLHKIEDGKADKSYGIFVGSLAGLPRKVLLDAKHNLEQLSKIEKKASVKEKKTVYKEQYSLFHEEKQDHEIITKLKKMDLNLVSPFEALSTLMKWKESLK